MNLQKVERTVIVTVGTRITLVGIAISNWDKASWSFARWSKTAAWQSNLMAGCIEGALVIFTYMLAQRLISNAKKLKSDPEQPTKILWSFVIFLSLLSAFCNAMYFVHFGRLANPLDNIWWSTAAGIILGIAAPVLAGGSAYLQGEEAATGIAVREAEEKREDVNRRRREKREAKKEEAETEKQHSVFSSWSTRSERLDAIVECVQELDPQHQGVTRERVFELVFNGRDESDSTKYADVSGLIKDGRLEKVGGLITWPQAEVRTF